jgi:hypothetical protein
MIHQLGGRRLRPEVTQDLWTVERKEDGLRVAPFAQNAKGGAPGFS